MERCNEGTGGRAKMSTGSANLLHQINALLPESERIPSGYMDHFRNCSDELLKCVILDRLEARLRKLDAIVAGTRVRRLEGNVWAGGSVPLPRVSCA